ncbi:hypothetical protein BIV25_06475 [Streptomyces sp. MUSC 14]|nr:hypothetical protein BIV25_06475 [Streptomyces sp. MUSC 14]
MAYSLVQDPAHDGAGMDPPLGRAEPADHLALRRRGHGLVRALLGECGYVALVRDRGETAPETEGGPCRTGCDPGLR